MSILVFEDAQVDQLAPITTARSAYCVTVGSYTLLDLLTLTQQSLVGFVRPHLRTLCSLDQPHVLQLGDPQLSDTPSPVLALNARLTPSIQTLETIRQILASGSEQSGIVWDGDQIAAVVRPKLELGCSGYGDYGRH